MQRFNTVLLMGIGLMLAAPAAAQSPGGVGIRAGIGTDISLGLAGGVELNYARMQGAGALELGLAVFGGRSTENTDGGGSCCSYTETTDIVVAAALANYLFGYNRPGPYFVAGFGFGAVSMSWREESPDDTSLGPSLPGGGSFDEEDGTVGGTVLNFGIGTRLSPRVDFRVQAPTFVMISDAPGEKSVVPTFVLTLGYRF